MFGIHWTISRKCLAGFGLVTLVLAAVGLADMFMIHGLQAALGGVAHGIPEADAAMEMRCILLGDMHLLMELMAAENPAEAGKIMAEREGHPRQFSAAAQALLHGGSVGDMHLPPVTDPQVRALTEEVLGAYGRIVEPGMQAAAALKARILALDDAGADKAAALEKELGELEERFDVQAEVLITRLEQMEVLTKGRLKTVLEQARSQGQLALGAAAGGVALGTILAILAGTLIGRSIAKPLKELAGVAERISVGEYSVRATANGNDETAALGRTFNALVDKVLSTLAVSEAVLNTIPAPVFLVDDNYTVLMSNDAYRRTMGDAAGDGRGHHCSKAFQSSACNTADCPIERVKRGQPLDPGLLIESDAEGQRRYLKPFAAVVRSVRGEVLGYLEVANDVTELVRHERRATATLAGIRQVSGEVESIAGQVAAAAEALAAQVEESSRGADEQQGRLAESASAMEQMNAAVLDVARNASRAAEIGEAMRHRATQGAGVVGQTSTSIGGLAQLAGELRRDMAELGSQAQGIGQIMGVIADIADQTNLLALNAAIEAARAGDAGRGFAVVADEVRKLAEKTMAATGDVTKAVEAIQSSAAKNVRSTEETAQTISRTTALASDSASALGELVGQAQETADQIRSIAAASEEQSASSEAIARASDEINRIAAETSSAMRQSSQTVNGLAELAGRLRDLISRMRRDSQA